MLLIVPLVATFMRASPEPNVPTTLSEASPEPSTLLMTNHGTRGSLPSRATWVSQCTSWR